MGKVMVSYKVRPERAEENVQLVRAVYAELERARPDGIRYAAFQLEDGVSFVHVASNETPAGSSPLTSLEAFEAYRRELRERCDEPPVFADLHEIGSYGMFG